MILKISSCYKSTRKLMMREAARLKIIKTHFSGDNNIINVVAERGAIYLDVVESLAYDIHECSMNVCGRCQNYSIGPYLRIPPGNSVPINRMLEYMPSKPLLLISE